MTTRKAQSKILNYSFTSPIIIDDFQQFFSIKQMYGGATCVVYCDPNDSENYKKVLKSMIKASKNFPINLVASQGDEYEADASKSVLFVLTRSPNLMFFQFKDMGP